jgi:DNA polymerase elongation subunit (family B)
MKPAALFDVELYRNFFLVLFKRKLDGRRFRFQISPNQKLDVDGLLHVMRNHLLVGFNSMEYDIPMIQLAIKGVPINELKWASDDIIVHGMKPRDFAAKYELPRPTWDHIDLRPIAPLSTSLKAYAGRLHAPKLQDLPIDPNKLITAEEASTLVEYCCNDLDNTELLFDELSAQIELRVELSKEYGQDLRSKSDPQVAEKVISEEVKRINRVNPGRPQGLEGTTFKYRIPEYVNYRLPQLKTMLDIVREAEFRVADGGKVIMPPKLEGYEIRIGGSTYRMGIGGLHSSEHCIGYTASEKVLLIDRDVASFYPRIILNQGLYPAHLGPAFLTVYQSLVERRLVAKKAKNTTTAESLKISINGTFGKLGSMWSVLYAPDLLIQVTLTGQLSLLLLIEMVEAVGIQVVSANTDGIVMRCPTVLQPLLDDVIAKWEKLTNFETEETQYSAIYSKDVNNYLAIKTDGKVKGKGLYANPWEKEGANIFKLHKNPSTTIVIEAMVALLRDNIPLSKTIRECRDIRKFLAVRSVTGGAHSKGEYLGKVVRWYYSTSTVQNILNYEKSGNKVPKTDGAKPLMELPAEFPTDVNYKWYEREAQAALGAIGYAQRTLFDKAA